MFQKLRVVLFLCVVCVSLNANAKSTLHKPWGMGKDYWLAFPKPGWGTITPSALISSPKQRLSITVPGSKKGALQVNASDVVQYLTGAFHVEVIPGQVDHGGATHIQGDREFSVVGQMGAYATKGSFLALPVTSWGTEYYVLGTAEGYNNGQVDFYSVPGITIIAQRNGTTITITPSTNTAGGHLAHVPFTVTLDAGDVYYLTSAADPNNTADIVVNMCDADLSGSHIESAFPVGVLTSNSFGSWPCGAQQCGDYGIEWLPPVSQWDTEYIVAQSVHRPDGEQGDVVRMMFSEDNTKVYVDDGSGPQLYGSFGAGQSADYIRSFTGMRLTANHPFLAMTITTNGNGCGPGSGGLARLNFSMTMQVGRHQWCSNATFGGVYYANAAILELLFPYSDEGNLFVNERPLLSVSPIVQRLPGGFAYVTMDCPLSNVPIHIHGINGATFTGSVYGYGGNIYGPGGNHDPQPQDPEAVCSVGHPIAASGVSLRSADTTAPHVAMNFGNCGAWTVTAFDDELDPPSSGIADISLAEVDSSDTSFNVAFHSTPSYQYGGLSANCDIDVINLLQPAQASLHIRDMAGNEFDTVVTYAPQQIDAIPAALNLGAIHVTDSKSGSITAFNRSAQPLSITSYRLRYGISKHWTIVTTPNVPASPTSPFVIGPGDSVKFYFQYTSPDTKELECDDDSLLLTTCREFTFASLHACNKKPAILASDATFECAKIDSAGYHGDTTSVPVVAVVNTGNDTLTVLGITLIGLSPSDVIQDPTFDFTIASLLPTTQQPWKIAPGDTHAVQVNAHPHHSGQRVAALVIANDASINRADTALLTACGMPPDINSVDEQSPMPDGLFLTAYPNPFGSSVSQAITVVFTLTQREHVTVDVCSVLGEVVGMLMNETRDAGAQRVVFDAAGLRSGIYFYRVRMGSNVAMKAVVVGR